MEKLRWSEFKTLVDSINPAIYSVKEDSSSINIFITLDGNLVDCDIDKSSGDYTVFQSSYRARLNLKNEDITISSTVIKTATLSDSLNPSNKIKVTANRDLSTSDTLNSIGVEGFLTVGTSAVELKVGANKLALRKLVTLYNNSNSNIYWGYTSSVTSATGTPIFKDQFVSWPVNDTVTIYLIAATAGNNVRITEGA